MDTTLKVLSYGSRDTTQSTILIIHGAFTSGASFIPIARLLEAKGYHVLLPDLPAHGSGTSGSIQPFTISTSVSVLANLIRDQAHSGKSHLIGFSLGAYLALTLAADHSNLVGRVFCTGGGRDWNWSPLTRNFVALSMYTLSNVPTWIEDCFNSKHQMVEPSELLEDDKRWNNKKTPKLYRDVLTGLAEVSAGDALDRVSSPVLLVSASAHDPVNGQRLWKERLLKGGCKEVKAVELKGYPHCWNLRDEDLFVECVTAWIWNKPLPDPFVEIV